VRRKITVQFEFTKKINNSSLSQIYIDFEENNAVRDFKTFFLSKNYEYLTFLSNFCSLKDVHFTYNLKKE